MGNMCCRREVYAPNGTDTEQGRCGHHQPHSVHSQHQQISKQQPIPAMSSAYHSAGDDCAINELLEGRMDLDVLMPDGRKVRLTVERRTPMMDLLVQAASATKISPGGHVIHVFGDGDKGNGALHYKPSTPIGSLDTKTICIVPKKEAGDPLARRMGRIANRPFEPTFRVQVHLPRNQLTVLRVSPRIKISELKSMVCKEKGLDTSRYQLVRPSGPAHPLSGDMTLAEYGSTEITLLSNSSIESHICNSTSHIIPYSKRTENNKRKTGILKLLTEDANNKVNETTNCNSTYRAESNQNKSNRSEDVHAYQSRYKPKKRRPAPPPPPPILPEAPSHSRQSSSDSSGYHEATSSFLHEEHSSEEKASSDSSGVSSLDAKDQTIQPAPAPIPNSKKKKAPAPPPPPKSHKERAPHRQAPACPSSERNSRTLENSVPVKDSVPKASETSAIADVQKPKESITTGCLSTKSNLTLADSVKINSSVNDRVESHVRDDEDSKKSFGKAGLTEQKDALNQKYHTIPPPKDTIKDPVVLLQTFEKEPILESLPALKKGPTTAEFSISTYSATVKDRVIRDDPVISKDNLAEKDCLSRENKVVAEENDFPTGGHLIPADHVMPKDIVSKQSTDTEKKLDLPHFLENEGQTPVTVAANALQGTNASKGLVKEKAIKLEPPLPATGNEENISVPDTYRCRTPENQIEKDRIPCKGEAVSTRVALVALNARIEQDVTQQEIASSIQAAFHSVDFAPQPSLLAIKQRNSEDSTTQSQRTPDKSGHTSTEPAAPPKSTTTVKVPLNLQSEDKNKKELLNEIKSRLSEREALVIDEEPLFRPVSTRCAPTKSLKRSSSLLNFNDVTHRNASLTNSKRVQQLQRSLSDLTTDGKEDFEAEQERLQREYLKLQRQFILWQQQLINNHAMLREECIVPQYARTLRQSHSLPEGEDTFEETTPSVPLVSRSLSYEPTKDRCSTLPRSTINITSLEFGNIPIGNGTSTLRSSKTKSIFKPPQIRASTKSRQRLPPEIKREGDVDITDDAKMLTTILPSFETLKLITENKDEISNNHLGTSRLKDTNLVLTKNNNNINSNTPTQSSEVRKVPVVHLSSTFPKLNSRLSNGDKTADRNLKYVNGDTGQSKLHVVCSTKMTEQSHNPPPPPPPMPQVDGVSKCSVNENSIKSTGHRNGVSKKEFSPQEDPRERLMLEIRKFGGRTALRKISLAS